MTPVSFGRGKKRINQRAGMKKVKGSPGEVKRAGRLPSLWPEGALFVLKDTRRGSMIFCDVGSHLGLYGS